MADRYVVVRCESGFLDGNPGYTILDCSKSEDRELYKQYQEYPNEWRKQHPKYNHTPPGVTGAHLIKGRKSSKDYEMLQLFADLLNGHSEPKPLL